MRRTALVTGAARGLGAAAARRLAAAAWDVVAVDVDELGLAKTAHRSPNTHVRVCDVTDPDAVAEVLAMTGPVHRVVHAASAASAGPVLAQPLHEVEHVLRTNVLGAVHIVRATLPGMLERRAGELFLCPDASGPPESPSAAAVAAYSDVLFAEHGGRGVALRCVHAAAGTPHGAVLDAMDRSLARPAADVHVRVGPARRPLLPALARR
ncbi:MULTISPECIES: SDR family NAD(P)-dependent oxidoreductase [unclassified Actinomadura]|uniref:SDR family NAD(P)-dependent oxidoreductase n=1 Tax=unclassified Actinomadura TaxID=2626254 RepID=UPI00135C106E|nr:SDR family NAD(P)-dependent oxidoreductase [Actinomadura sp. K4S16]